MEWWQIILIIIGVLLLVYIAGSIYFYRYIFKRSKNVQPTTKKAMKNVKRINENDWYDACPKKHFEIKSRDGLRLHADLLLNVGSHNYAILVHGYKSHRRSATAESKMFYDLGFNCFHISNRNHDESEGLNHTMGDRERFDLVDWTKAINEYDKDAKILLFGRSMGANIVMETVGEELPSNVLCAISECGYTSCYEQMIHMTKSFLPIARIFMVGVDLYCKVFRNFNIRQSAIDQLKKCKIPMLFMHGTDDNFVPIRMLDEVVNACASKKQVEIFEGATHCDSIVVHTERYKQVVKDFINNNFK